jgi:D-tyrosyl-tRNA(Tyr) deacylase
MPGRAVYFFCSDLGRDPVAAHVFDAVRRCFEPREAGFEVDGKPVLELRDGDENLFTFVRLHDVLSHDYPRYLGVLEQRFSDYDFGGVVNWHEGANAPDAIFCLHTTGDLASGEWGVADPALTTSLARALESSRQSLGLDGFTTTTEATHWSGAWHGDSPELIPRYPVPLVDVEIGSSPATWADPRAAEVMARALVRIFDPVPAGARSLLCVGGVHFERAFAAAALESDDRHPLLVSHILANQWLVSGGYGEESGLEKLRACVQSIRGGVHAIAFHDNLKGPYKAPLRVLSEELGVPLFKYQKLRQPEELGLWS